MRNYWVAYKSMLEQQVTSPEGDQDLGGEERNLRQVVEEKHDKTPNPDEIVPRVLKQWLWDLTCPWAKILRKTLNSGFVSSLWKLANQIPIFKGKKRISMFNHLTDLFSSTIM